MRTEKRKYDSTIARMAGNIAGALAIGIADPETSPASFASGVERVSKTAVCLARAIVVEVIRTEPEPAK